MKTVGEFYVIRFKDNKYYNFLTGKKEKPTSAYFFDSYELAKRELERLKNCCPRDFQGAVIKKVIVNETNTEDEYQRLTLRTETGVTLNRVNMPVLPVIERLAEYEDIGSPEELKRLKNIK